MAPAPDLMPASAMTPETLCTCAASVHVLLPMHEPVEVMQLLVLLKSGLP